MKIPALLALVSLATATPTDPSSWAPSLRTCFHATGALDEPCWAARVASLRALVVHEHFETAIRQLRCDGDGDGDGKAAAEGAPAPAPETPLRHKAGMKCAGAAGFPSVEYLGCEDGYECTGAAQDWGNICVPSATPTPVPAPAPALAGLSAAIRARVLNAPSLLEDGTYYCRCGRTCRYWERNGGQPVC